MWMEGSGERYHLFSVSELEIFMVDVWAKPSVPSLEPVFPLYWQCLYVILWGGV